jgi:dGTPase
MQLAAYACDPLHSRGRRYPEQAAPTRNDFQRDRDRIVHSSAFRRLVYKTQVFINHEGDMFRTRLTHSLEVAQLGRSIARALQLNEDLVETIALAHDLGHTPFGHAGQDALHGCMASHGGFEHNLQSLRVVDYLEQRYPDFDGLNLTFESREGILKHCSRTNAQLLEAVEPPFADGAGGVGRRFLERTEPSLEAQLCNLADEIAYNAHDIDDGVRSGFITLEQLQQVDLFRTFEQQALAQHPSLAEQGKFRRRLYATIRLMLSHQVYDVIDTTQSALKAAAVQSVHDVRASAPLVGFSAAMREQSRALKVFLKAELYRHPQVVHTMDMAKQVIVDLFAAYTQRPGEMHIVITNEQDLPRTVADYIAGMTDRFAVREHHRLTGKKLLPLEG